MHYKTLLFVIILCIIASCNSKHEGPLPIIGDRSYPDGTVDIHQVRPFEFVNQLGETISKKDLDGKIYLADFFFTYCPSICPKVTNEMLRIYDYVEKEEDILLVSFTLDPTRDSIPVLKAYADNIGIDHNKWLFLRGDEETVLEMANEDYFVAALISPDAPGGFDHSGKVILLDKKGKIRGFCEGTEPDSVDKMMGMIDRLRSEYE